LKKNGEIYLQFGRSSDMGERFAGGTLEIVVGTWEIADSERKKV
jgi:hypothetical protein